MKGNGNNGRRRLAGAAIRCQPDPRLVGLVRDGHDQAFEEIVRRYRAPLVSYASGIVPDHHAEDVVQEALTKAHAALGRSDAEISLRPWLYTIVRNGALNAIRDEPVHDHLDESFDGVPQPPEVVARREELATLTDGVRNLPGPQREAIVKRELEGRSHEEIATSLGVSTGAVRGLIYRARTALRDGAGMLIPLPVLRALLGSGTASPEAAGAAGTAAAGLAAGGGGGVAVKAGATLGVAVLAVGSGFAIQHRGGGSPDQRASPRGVPAHSSHARGGGGSSAVRFAGSGGDRGTAGGREGESSEDSGRRDGHRGSSGSSGPGPGSRSRSGSSGEGSGAGDDVDGGGHSGSGSGGVDGGGDRSGTSGGGGDGGGSLTSGDGSGTSGGGSSSGTGDDGLSGSSGSGSSGTSSSGSASSGSGSGGVTSDSGSGSETTTTTTTTTDGAGGGGSSGSG